MKLCATWNYRTHRRLNQKEKRNVSPVILTILITHLINAGTISSRLFLAAVNLQPLACDFIPCNPIRAADAFISLVAHREGVKGRE